MLCRYERTPSAISWITTAGMMCAGYSAPVGDFSGLACARGSCSTCGPKHVFARHVCPCEHDTAKLVTVRLIDTVDVPGGNLSQSRAHFKTHHFTRQEFQERKEALAAKFASHHYFARHARAGASVLGAFSSLNDHAYASPPASARRSSASRKVCSRPSQARHLCVSSSRFQREISPHDQFSIDRPSIQGHRGNCSC